MGSIRVHEFISLDGVIDAATWQRAGVEVYDNGVTYLHLTPAPG